MCNRVGNRYISLELGLDTFVFKAGIPSTTEYTPPPPIIKVYTNTLIKINQRTLFFIIKKHTKYLYISHKWMKTYFLDGIKSTSRAITTMEDLFQNLPQGHA